MSAKYTLNSNTTTGDRLGNLENAAVQLSTGDLVMLVKDPSATDPNKVTLQLVPGTAHTTPQVIATLSVAAAGGASTFSSGRDLSICRDASDNLYVGGWDCATETGFVLQAFIKQTGLTWTQQTATTAPGVSTAPSSYGIDMVWCATGGGVGGAGHIAVLGVQVVLSLGGQPFRAIMSFDAGVALSGTGNPFASGWNGGYAGGVTVPFRRCQSISPNGFGTASGLAIFQSFGGTNTAAIYSWSVSSSGSVTAGQVTNAVFTTGTLSATTKFEIWYVSNNRWAYAYPSGANAGQLTVGLASTTSINLGTGQVDTGTTSNFPAPSATLSWDGVVAAQSLYVYGWSSATATTMLRLPYTFPNDNPTKGAVVTDDTAVGAGTNTTIRLVNQPVDIQHTDWQAYNTTSPFSLLGDFSALPGPPNAPTLTAPAAGAAAYIATGGTFSWQFSSTTLNDAQTSYAFKRQAQGGAVQWWNGAAWQSTEIFVTSAVASVTFPTGQWTAGTTYQWSVAVKGVSVVAGAYAPLQTVYSAQTPPTAPTLAAAYDSTNNRVTVTITGTGTDTATVQVSRDGGATWANLRNGSVVLAAGAGTAYDYEAQPGLTSSYRATQLNTSQVPYAVASAASATVTATPAITTFWLRNPADGSIGQAVHVKEGSLALQLTENSTAHYPLGSQYPVILADAMKGEDGGATLMTFGDVEEAGLKALMQQQNTLLLQASDNRQWYVRMNGARARAVPQGTGATKYKEWAVAWLNVAAP